MAWLFGIFRAFNGFQSDIIFDDATECDGIPAEFFPYVIHGAFHFFARFVLDVFAGKKGKLLGLVFRAQIDGCNSKHSDGVTQVPGLFDDRDSGICDVFCQIGRVI